MVCPGLIYRAPRTHKQSDMHLSSLSYATHCAPVKDPQFELHTTFVMSAGCEADGAVGAVWRAAGARRPHRLRAGRQRRQVGGRCAPQGPGPVARRADGRPGARGLCWSTCSYSIWHHMAG